MTSRSIALVLAGVILVSFAGGVLLYLSPEQRAEKLEQQRLRYEAKYAQRLRAPR